MLFRICVLRHLLIGLTLISSFDYVQRLCVSMPLI